VGIAFLQLGRLSQLTMYGTAYRSKHSTLTDLGAVPIDYHAQDFVEVIRQAEPEGLDLVFNGMGEEYFERGLAVLRRGGVFVHYCGPQSLSRSLLLLAKFVLYLVLPNGKAIKGYGTHRVDSQLPEEDWGVRSNQTPHRCQVPYPGGGQSQRIAGKRPGRGQRCLIGAGATLDLKDLRRLDARGAFHIKRRFEALQVMSEFSST